MTNDTLAELRAIAATPMFKARLAASEYVMDLDEPTRRHGTDALDRYRGRPDEERRD